MVRAPGGRSCRTATMDCADGLCKTLLGLHTHSQADGSIMMAVEDVRSIGVFDLIRRQRAWFAPIPLVIAAGLGIGAVLTAQEAETVEAEGVQTEAVVLETERRRERVGGDRVWRNYVTYRFELEDGTAQRNRDRVSRSFHDSVSEGDEITVTYLPDDPRTAEIDPEGTRHATLIFGLASVGTAGLGAWMLRRYGRRCSSMLRAIRRGESRTARVTGRTNTVPRAQDQKTWRLHWTDIRFQSGSSLQRSLGDLVAWSDGDDITIYIDPKTSTGWWEEDILRPAS